MAKIRVAHGYFPLAIVTKNQNGDVQGPIERENETRQACDVHTEACGDPPSPFPPPVAMVANTLELKVAKRSAGWPLLPKEREGGGLGDPRRALIPAAAGFPLLVSKLQL